MGHLRTPSKFKKSSQQRSNLLLSSKLQRQAKEKKKQKWSFINNKFQRTIIPLERLSRQFAFEWKIKQSLKGHFFIQGENKQKKFKDFSERKSKSFGFPQGMVITSKKKKVELLNEKFVLSRGKKSIANSSKINLFLSLWESRLDICLWKANLVPSISISRELIHSGFIEVNGKIVKKQSKLLQKGDFVQIKQAKTSKFSTENQKFFAIKDLLKEISHRDFFYNIPCFARYYNRKISLDILYHRIEKKKTINISSHGNPVGFPQGILKINNQELSKNILYQTLFFQKSGLDQTFFFTPKVKKTSSEKITVLNSSLYLSMIIINNFLSFNNTKTNYLTTSKFFNTFDINIPSSFAQTRLKLKF